MADIVNALLVRNGTILLGRRNPERKAYPNRWSFPGGHVEEGESLDAALLREVREEVGVTPVMFRKLGVIEEPNPQGNGKATYHMYEVTAWGGGEPHMLGGEHSEIRWFSIDTANGLRDLALPQYRTIFRQLRLQ